PRRTRRPSSRMTPPGQQQGRIRLLPVQPHPAASSDRGADGTDWQDGGDTSRGALTMLRIRQIALVARHDLVAAQEFIDVLGLAIAFHDPGIKNLGLHNTLMPIGTQLLEIVAPITEGTTAERFLLRRKGAGGYMVITQTDDHPPRRARVDD